MRRERDEDAALGMGMSLDQYRSRYQEAATMSEKLGTGQLRLRGMQGLAELGNAFDKALPDTPTQDVPGIVTPTALEVSEIKNPEMEAPQVKEATTERPVVQSVGPPAAEPVRAPKELQIELPEPEPG